MHGKEYSNIQQIMFDVKEYLTKKKRKTFVSQHQNEITSVSSKTKCYKTPTRRIVCQYVCTHIL